MSLSNPDPLYDIDAHIDVSPLVDKNLPILRNVNPLNGNITGDASKFIGRTEIEYGSYAGTDIVAEILLPGESPLVLGELQTISYSIHRENSPVRVVGHTNALAFIKGPRTIAGSLIFTVFNQYAFYRLVHFQNMVQATQGAIFPLADMLPPFDIVITFSNELGSFSKMKIFGVTIVDEGQTMSVDDLITEQTYTYMARGIQPMTHFQPSNLQPTANPIGAIEPSRDTLRFA